jgi:hypothetical protein
MPWLQSLAIAALIFRPSLKYRQRVRAVRVGYSYKLFKNTVKLSIMNGLYPTFRSAIGDFQGLSKRYRLKASAVSGPNRGPQFASLRRSISRQLGCWRERRRRQSIRTILAGERRHSPYDIKFVSHGTRQREHGVLRDRDDSLPAILQDSGQRSGRQYLPARRLLQLLPQ